MHHYEKLTVEQKIKMLRIANNYTLDQLGAVIGLTGASICFYESKDEKRKSLKYDYEQIRKIKKHFGIENAPLLDGEDIYFKEQMLDWLDIIFQNRIDEAKEMMKKLSVIIRVPYETELTFLYLIFETKIMLQEKKLKEAEDRLNFIDRQLLNNKVKDDEVSYHHCYTVASLEMAKGNYDKAIELYYEIEDLDAKNFIKGLNVHFNIAQCQSKMGRYVKAISAMERIRHFYDYEVPSLYRIILYNSLGINYARIGDTDEAKNLLERALNDAEIIDSEEFAVPIIHNLGCAHLRENKYKVALDYFENVSAKINENHQYYLENLYHKAVCVILLERQRQEVEDILSAGKTLSKGKEMYSILFESLGHLSVCDKAEAKESREYLENKTIPYLISELKYNMAIFYCEQLKKYYFGATRSAKAHEMDGIINEITSKAIK